MSEPRQFWIFKGDSNFCAELEYDIHKEMDVKARPDGFYDIVSMKDTVEGGVHVIEKAAYDELEKKLKLAIEALELIADKKPSGNYASDSAKYTLAKLKG